MEIFQQRPTLRLRPFVDRFWGWRSAPGERIALPTLLPGTGAELFIHAGAPFGVHESGGARRLARAQLFCLRESRRELLPMCEVDFIAVRLRVGALPRFLAAPVADVQDRDCEAGALWGAEAEACVARVCSEADFKARVAHLEAFLLARLEASAPADPLITHAVAALYVGEPDMRIEALAAAHGLGVRQFERRFARVSGVGPASLRRLVRFQRAVRHGLVAPEPLARDASLLDAALGAGYYDQAHFIRDFRALAGETPVRFFRAAREKTHFYNPSWPTAAIVSPVL
ncbi:helix-turn-helix domain-containing protein [Niveibacterium sp. SC-1]|uniref:AraC family transcriptional regulator n=1 Tax=Niveibacterium sp. SC-1 TaxID=3135646 RepID=UPI00311FEF22